MTPRGLSTSYMSIIYSSYIKFTNRRLVEIVQRIVPAILFIEFHEVVERDTIKPMVFRSITLTVREFYDYLDIILMCGI